MKNGIIARIRAFFTSLFGFGNGNTGADAQAQSGPVSLKRPFTLMDVPTEADPLISEIMTQDLKGVDSPLGLMKKYFELLKNTGPHDDIDKKLGALFRRGRTPDPLDGFHHGVAISIQTGVASADMLGKLKTLLPDAIDPLQLIFTRLVSDHAPWAGKNFTKLTSEKLLELTGGKEDGSNPGYLGINSFWHKDRDFLNNLSGEVLSSIIDMKGVPGPEGKQRSWIYAKGGLFIAQKRKTVDPDSPSREVTSLNYRYESLGNRLPNNLLVDELVQIAAGLYLGKLFYATSLKHLMTPYDPDIPNEEYRYRCFGYFLLMDDTWLHEKNMLFPELAYKLADDLPKKLTTLTLVDAKESDVLETEAKKKKTVLHYLQSLSDGVTTGTAGEERYFNALEQLFLLGRTPGEINGFLHGGVVAFKSSGLLKKLGENILNKLWPTVRPFSPWTGKTFKSATVEQIEPYLGKDATQYADAAPLILGSNTYRKELDLSIGAESFVENLTLIGMKVEYPDETEADPDVHVQSFFFVASESDSLCPKSNRKRVLQLNYRWTALHTMPPDNLCIDELVRIADGLYLGRMFYATQISTAYDPKIDPKQYGYETFGYFMLMDDDWWSIKEFICFDTE